MQNRQCKGTAAKRGISLLLVVGAFFAIGGGQELAADDNADAIIRDGIIHSANGNFADFRHQYQSRLLFALDGVLARQAESALTDNFAAVKKADVQLQTTLGNRKGQIGMNVIGAFAESQNSAFGWQVRAFGAENDTKGANAGIFFRRVDGESLYGINSFADYEDGKYGDFLRYGIGGELQNPFAALAINYYLPITDDKRQDATVAFSQKGYDANLRINIPRLDYLKLRADYYLFDGKYGGKDDKGFRYGLEVQPISNLRIGAFYDDGGEKFGGDIVYVYNFGIPQKRESKVAFSPDLFSPILREYSQRIVMTTTERIEVLRTPISVMTTRIITPERVFTTAMTMAGMTTILTTETPTMTITRMASAYFTTRLDYTFTDRNGVLSQVWAVATTSVKYLITLPLAPVSRPLVITTTRDLDTGGAAGLVIERSSNNRVAVGSEWFFNAGNLLYTLTIAEGSEDFISVAITLTNKNTTTVPHIITETPMTNAAMTITTKLTTFATSTITTGAAKVDSRLPPSFPPFPQVPKIAFADPVILARRAGIQHTNAAACGGKGADAPSLNTSPEGATCNSTGQSAKARRPVNRHYELTKAL